VSVPDRHRIHLLLSECYRLAYSTDAGVLSRNGTDFSAAHHTKEERRRSELHPLRSNETHWELETERNPARTCQC
jgi:hypothetical protein